MMRLYLISANTSGNSEEVERVNAELTEHLSKLHTDLAELNNKYQSQVADNSQLSRYDVIEICYVLDPRHSFVTRFLVIYIYTQISRQAGLGLGSKVPRLRTLRTVIIWRVSSSLGAYTKSRNQAYCHRRCDGCDGCDGSIIFRLDKESYMF